MLLLKPLVLKLLLLKYMYCVHIQVSLTFVVYDWDGPLIGDDLLGVAKLNLTKVRPHSLYPG